MKPLLPSFLQMEKPWGAFSQYTLNELSTVKILSCNPGCRLSLQLHHHREECWVALDSGSRVEIGEHCFYPQPGEALWIPKETLHRLSCEAQALSPVRILEISFGHFDEEDIERVEDDYSRVTPVLQDINKLSATS